MKRGKEILEHSGGQEIAAASEKAGDFANADRPMPRVRTAGSSHVVTDDYVDTREDV